MPAKLSEMLAVQGLALLVNDGQLLLRDHAS